MKIPKRQADINNFCENSEMSPLCLYQAVRVSLCTGPFHCEDSLGPSLESHYEAWLLCPLLLFAPLPCEVQLPWLSWTFEPYYFNLWRLLLSECLFTGLNRWLQKPNSSFCFTIAKIYVPTCQMSHF